MSSPRNLPWEQRTPKFSKNAVNKWSIKNIIFDSSRSSLWVPGLKFQAAPASLEPRSPSFVLALASHSEEKLYSSELTGKVSKYKSPCVRHTCPGSWCSCKTLHLRVWGMRTNTTLGHHHPHQGGSSGRSQRPLYAGTGSRRSKTSREAEGTTSWQFSQTGHSELFGRPKGLGLSWMRHWIWSWPVISLETSLNKPQPTWCRAFSVKLGICIMLFV